MIMRPPHWYKEIFSPTKKIRTARLNSGEVRPKEIALEISSRFKDSYQMILFRPSRIKPLKSSKNQWSIIIRPKPAGRSMAKAKNKITSPPKKNLVSKIMVGETRLRAFLA